MNRLVTLWIVALLLCLAPGMGEATPILDQFHHPVGNNGFIVENTQWLAQSFTVGVSGTLSGFKADVARDALPALGIDWELRRLDAAGLPKGSLLASGTLAPDDVLVGFNFIPVDLTSFAIPVGVGETYAIVLTTLEPPHQPLGGINPYAWAIGQGLFGRDYLRGTVFVKFPELGIDWSAQPNDSGLDFGFETFVDCPRCNPVPEPSALTLLGFALGFRAMRTGSVRWWMMKMRTDRDGA